LAITVVSVLRVNWQVPVPKQPPPIQPVNPVPEAVSVTVPLLKGAEQFAVQFVMPGGLDETDPVPATWTVRIGRLKLAVTVVADVTVKSQVPAPLHTVAVQPVKFETLLGVAVITMAVPGR
jgi:hypothetical protein